MAKEIAVILADLAEVVCTCQEVGADEFGECFFYFELVRVAILAGEEGDARCLLKASKLVGEECGAVLGDDESGVGFGGFFDDGGEGGAVVEVCGAHPDAFDEFAAGASHDGGDEVAVGLSFGGGECGVESGKLTEPQKKIEVNLRRLLLFLSSLRGSLPQWLFREVKAV